jgi:UDP-hydrolysing UDP-N-acetyl-D-glucosamine 2-epimerase
MIVIGSRANYGSSKSIIKHINNSKNSELILVASASSVLDRFGDVSELIELDGFKVNYRLFNLLDGNSLVTMPKSVGIGLIDLSNIMFQENPDIVITVGDRFETMATAIAASYLNIPLAHVMGGEISGTLDESIRHAITKLSHIHFPASDNSAERIIKMGENSEFVFNFGCPRIDEVKLILDKSNSPDYLSTVVNKVGVGANLNLNLPFILFSYHPVTSEYDSIDKEIEIILKSIDECNLPVLALWPNSDAGYEIISRRMRVWQQKPKSYPLRVVKNLTIETFFSVMNLTSCQVGNSSSALREGSYIGTPAVNIGTRQQNRESGKNVIFVEPEQHLIVEAIIKQINHGKYESVDLFGNGSAGIRIVETLERIQVSTQKQIAY